LNGTNTKELNNNNNNNNNDSLNLNISSQNDTFSLKSLNSPNKLKFKAPNNDSPYHFEPINQDLTKNTTKQNETKSKSPRLDLNINNNNKKLISPVNDTTHNDAVNKIDDLQIIKKPIPVAANSLSKPIVIKDNEKNITLKNGLNKNLNKLDSALNDLNDKNLIKTEAKNVVKGDINEIVLDKFVSGIYLKLWF
jgi:hypothetical protein